MTETTPRLWVDFARIIESHCPFMHLAFPNQKGPQMLLQKAHSLERPKWSDRDKANLIEFEQMAQQHELRTLSGRERQVKKAAAGRNHVPIA